MILRTPFGWFRLEPFRALRRVWLRLTAPRTATYRVLIGEEVVQIRDLTDAEVLILRSQNVEGSFWLGLEVRRRSLPDILPQWAAGVSAVFPDRARMAFAELILRPESL